MAGVLTIKETAMQNYGRTWTKEMIAAIVARGKLTTEDYKEITGEDYISPTTT